MTARKLRRSRDAPQASSFSAYELYHVQGDAAASLEAHQDAESFHSRYNRTLLEYLTSSQTADARVVEQVTNQLGNLHEEFDRRTAAQDQVSRKRRRNEFILAYNLALLKHANGQADECIQICSQKLTSFIETKQKIHEAEQMVLSRMAFLMIECALVMCVGRISSTTHKDLHIPEFHKTMAWLDTFALEKDHQLKFLLALFKSRIDLARLDPKTGRHADANIRAAKKELKTAMETFQHKLRSSFGDNGSVVSSTNSEENSTVASGNHDAPQIITSAVLQKLNQSALTMKAHLEELKGNTKKSVILCSEALHATEETSSYQAIHANNLGIVYETYDKKQMAIHALAKGIRHCNEIRDSFHLDGTAIPDPSLALLSNASICALQAGNFLASYETMAVCMSRSTFYRRRGRCWLRLAEACLGINSKATKPVGLFSAVDFEGKVKGILFEQDSFIERREVLTEELVATLGSQEDLEQVQSNPLLRARNSLEMAMSCSVTLDDEARIAANLMQSFVLLGFRDYQDALEYARTVMTHTVQTETPSAPSKEMYAQRLAIARMYAAEASCGMGDTVSAMHYIAGDGSDSEIDRLASDLGGVTMETASLNTKGKSRLARAQTAVRASASAVMAVVGNEGSAKKLAMSAQAMEDAYASNREHSSARRALIYSLLRCGNSSAALKLLRSMRVSKNINNGN